MHLCTVTECSFYFIILELDSLFNEARTLLSKSGEKRDQLRVLEAKLGITDDQTRQRCIMEGRSLAVKHKLESLQADMEMFYLSVKKKQVAIQSFASKSTCNVHGYA